MYVMPRKRNYKITFKKAYPKKSSSSVYCIDQHLLLKVAIFK